MESGLFLIKKPKEWTSRDVINKLVHKFHSKKIGHCGTLDPFAEGLLVCVSEKCTKLIPYLEDLKKEYIAELSLGEKTDSGDLTGNIIEKREISFIENDKIKEFMNSFKGENEQIPPMYSAIQVNGRRLYSYARNGEKVEVKPRKIFIYEIELLSFIDNVVKFRVVVSKGTYIRTLGEDIARKLGTVGHLKSLVRTKVGNFSLENSKTWEEINASDFINPIKCEYNLPKIKLDSSIDFKVRKGQAISYESPYEQILFVSDDELVAVYEKKDNNLYVCKRGLL